MERHLAAILAADIVGYSALMERDEVGTFARLKVRRKQLIEPHPGRMFKLMGDGPLAEFASVVDVVECAMALQRVIVEVTTAMAKVSILPQGSNRSPCGAYSRRRR
jgi:class 3 adenylate cyclase